MLKGLSTALLCFALVGCVDPKKSLDDYSARVVDGNTSMPDRPNLTSIPDVNGQFLFAGRPNLPEDRIFEMIEDVTMTANADGTATVGYTGTFLKTSDHTPSASGLHIGASGSTVALDGTFIFPITGTLPGDANPVIPGSNAPLSGSIHGVIMSKDFICGTLTGSAGSLPLAGSTFAMQRITPGTIGSALPAPVWKCPDTTTVDGGMPDAM